ASGARREDGPAARLGRWALKQNAMGGRLAHDSSRRVSAPVVALRHRFDERAKRTSLLDRQEERIEHMVRDPSPLLDAFRLVEAPVDAEIDSALPVLLLGLRERRVASHEERPCDAIRALSLGVV